MDVSEEGEIMSSEFAEDLKGFFHICLAKSLGIESEKTLDISRKT